MHDLHVGTQDNVPPCQSQSGADVHVLVVQKVPLIKTAQIPEHRRGEQHEHPCDPIGAHRLATNVVVEALFSANYLSGNTERGRKAPGTILDTSVWMKNQRARQRGFSMVETVQQLFERVLVQPDIGIQHAEIIARNESKRVVVICAKTFRTCISDNTYRIPEIPWFKWKRFGFVECQYEPDVAAAVPIDVAQQLAQHFALAMTDY